MAPQGVQQSNNLHQSSDPVNDNLTVPLFNWIKLQYKNSDVYVIKLLHPHYITGAIFVQQKV